MGGLGKKKPKQKAQPVAPVPDMLAIDRDKRRQRARLGASDTIMSQALGG